MYSLTQAQFAEEERQEKVQNRTTQIKCQLYTIRIVCFLLVLGLLGGAIYAIILSLSASTDPVSKTFIVIATIMTLIRSFLSLIEHKTTVDDSYIYIYIHIYIYIYIYAH